MAGHVESFTESVPALTAAVNLGALPNSPKLTAAASISEKHHAPIKRSACKPV